MSSDSLYHCFAWDGFSFEVPQSWNLARHETRNHISRLAMEDDFALRLEMEWSRSGRKPAAAQIRRRFNELSEAMRKTNAKASVLADLPLGWSAGLYTMPDGRHRLNLLYLTGGDFIAIFTVHFSQTSVREPLRLARHLTNTFAILTGPVIAWEVFDLKFELNREFVLAGTSFQAGSKLMSFEWRWRRFFIWWFSPATVIAARQPVEEWCVRTLNRFKTIRGPIFSPGTKPDQIVWKRNWRYPFGKFEDLYRGCQKYRVHCETLTANNILLLTVFQYRKDSDLLEPKLKCF